MKRYQFWSFQLILSLCVLGLSIKYLALQEVSFSESLILRGVSCGLIVILYSMKKNLSMRPRKIKTQVFRAIIAGLALTFFTLSYNSISASTISVLSHIDVPLIVLLSPLIGQSTSKKSKLLAAISIAILIFFTRNLENESYSGVGLIYLFLGVFLLSIGYLFIKKSMEEENISVTILIPSIALIIYGFLNLSFDHTIYKSWSLLTLFMGFVSGIAMNIAYVATTKLYSLTSIAEAEFPTLLSSLVIFPLEFYLLKQDFKWIHVVLSLGFIVITYYVIKAQNEVAPIDVQ